MEENMHAVQWHIAICPSVPKALQKKQNLKKEVVLCISEKQYQEERAESLKETEEFWMTDFASGVSYIIGCKRRDKERQNCGDL